MTTIAYISGVIEKLEAWKEHDFHADRQLADEVLIADGWKVESNAEWEGGVRWYLPGNPEISSSESHRPHVIHDLNRAIGVVPFRYSICLIIDGRRAKATVWLPGDAAGHEGESELPAVAVLIAALKAKLMGLA